MVGGPGHSSSRDTPRGAHRFQSLLGNLGFRGIIRCRHVSPESVPLVVATLVSLLLNLVGIYLLAGLIFAGPFVIRGVQQVDASAAGSTRGFRLIILPGVIALWPWLAWRWRRKTPAVEHNAHRDHAGRVAEDNVP